MINSDIDDFDTIGFDSESEDESNTRPPRKDFWSNHEYGYGIDDLQSDAEDESEFGLHALKNLEVFLKTIRTTASNVKNEQLETSKLTQLTSLLSMISKTRERFFGHVLSPSADGIDFEDFNLVTKYMSTANKTLPSNQQFKFYLAKMYNKNTNKLDFRKRIMTGDKVYIYKTCLKEAVRCDGKTFDFSDIPVNKLDLIGPSVNWEKEDSEKTILLGIPFNHQFESFCVSKSPLLSGQFLLQEVDHSTSKFNEYLETFLHKYPVVDHRNDVQYLVTLIKLLTKACNFRATLSFLREIFCIQHTKEDFQPPVGVENALGKLLQTVPWENLKDIIENAFSQIGSSQYLIWTNIATSSGIPELINSMIAIVFSNIVEAHDNYENYREEVVHDNRRLWQIIFHQVCNEQPMFDRWFDLFLKSEEILKNNHLVLQLTIETIKTRDDSLHPKMLYLFKKCIKSFEDKRVFGFADHFSYPIILTELFRALCENFDHFKKELDQLCSCLLSKMIHRDYCLKPLLELSTCRFDNLDGFTMVLNAYLDNCLETDFEGSEGEIEEMASLTKILLNGNVFDEKLVKKFLTYFGRVERWETHYELLTDACNVTYYKILLFLISNDDWEPSLEILRTLLEAGIVKKYFDDHMDLMYEMKIRNTENFKEFLRFTINSMDILFVDGAKRNKLSTLTYNHIRKLVRLLLKNACFSDVVPHLLASKVFQVNGTLNFFIYKKKSVLQNLIVDLKADFGMMKAYGSLLLVRALTLKSNAIKPQLCWKQPNAEIRNHPVVTAFLKGDNDTFIYHNPDAFPTMDEARRWIGQKTHCIFSDDSSDFTGIARQVDGVIEVVLQKKQTEYQKQLKEYAKRLAELERLKRELKSSFPGLFTVCCK
ncbi:uncharacterized protein [Clytia hemisphaerica]